MISIDPGRDTPKKIAEYVAHFHPDLLGVTGNSDTIAKLTILYGVFFEKHEGTKATGHLVDHTATVTVIDQDSHVKLIFSSGLAGKEIAEDISYLIKRQVIICFTSRLSNPKKYSPLIAFFRKEFQLTKNNWSLLFSLVILLSLVLAACQAKPEGPAISIDNVWGWPSPKVATVGVFYLVIGNAGSESDTLLSSSSSACGFVELHESYKTEEGVMGMRPVEGGIIEIAAGEVVELRIGGMHIMCVNKLVDFEPGVVLPLTLEFEKSGNMDVDVEIREP